MDSIIYLTIFLVIPIVVGGFLGIKFGRWLLNKSIKIGLDSSAETYDEIFKGRSKSSDVIRRSNDAMQHSGLGFLSPKLTDDNENKSKKDKNS
jgi:hypothetical protein